MIKKAGYLPKNIHPFEAETAEGVLSKPCWPMIIGRLGSAATGKRTRWCASTREWWQGVRRTPRIRVRATTTSGMDVRTALHGHSADYSLRTWDDVIGDTTATVAVDRVVLRPARMSHRGRFFFCSGANFPRRRMSGTSLPSNAHSTRRFVT